MAINDSLVNELRWHLADLDYPAKGEPVWSRCNIYTDHRAEPLTGSALMKLVQAIASRAGLTDEHDRPCVMPHVLRATGASLAVASGVSPHIAKEQLGHSRVRTTQRHYLHLPATDALKQFGAVFE